MLFGSPDLQICSKFRAEHVSGIERGSASRVFRTERHFKGAERLLAAEAALGVTMLADEVRLYQNAPPSRILMYGCRWVGVFEEKWSFDDPAHDNGNHLYVFIVCCPRI